jgi:hypothetical protein
VKRGEATKADGCRRTGGAGERRKRRGAAPAFERVAVLRGTRRDHPVAAVGSARERKGAEISEVATRKAAPQERICAGAAKARSGTHAARAPCFIGLRGGLMRRGGRGGGRRRRSGGGGRCGRRGRCSCSVCLRRRKVGRRVRRVSRRRLRRLERRKRVRVGVAGGARAWALELQATGVSRRRQHRGRVRGARGRAARARCTQARAPRSAHLRSAPARPPPTVRRAQNGAEARAAACERRAPRRGSPGGDGADRSAAACGSSGRSMLRAAVLAPTRVHPARSRAPPRCCRALSSRYRLRCTPTLHARYALASGRAGVSQHKNGRGSPGVTMRGPWRCGELAVRVVSHCLRHGGVGEPRCERLVAALRRQPRQRQPLDRMAEPAVLPLRLRARRRRRRR